MDMQTYSVDIDNLGRVKLPRTLRQQLNWEPNTSVPVQVNIRQGAVSVASPEETCICCGKTSDLIFKGKPICQDCKREISIL